MDARAAVGAAALGVNRADLRGQGLVLALTLATLARPPGVVTRSGHPVEPAHHRDVVLSPVYFDELEDFRFRPEANRMAFFRSSCSSLSTLYRRSRSLSLRSSAVVCTSSFDARATITLSLTCFRHSDSMKG